MNPIRLRISRTTGFDLQAHSMATNGLPAVNVTRPSRWGNPWRIEPVLGGWRCVHEDGTKVRAASEAEARGVAVSRYRAWVTALPGWQMQAIRRELRGHNLACWCPLPEADQPDCCHAAVLLEAANAPEPAAARPEGSWWFSCVECGWGDYAAAEPEECPVCGLPDLHPASPESGIKP